jgi:hypothetical protein
MWAAVGTARWGSVRGYGCAAAPGRPGRRRTGLCASASLGHPGAWLPEGMGEGGSGLPRSAAGTATTHTRARGSTSPRGDVPGRQGHVDGGGSAPGHRGSPHLLALRRATRVVIRRAAVAWSSPGAPTRAGGCRPTSRGFASELMTCPALLHLSDRISAVLLDVREHTNGTDRSQRSMARSHIPELVRATGAMTSGSRADAERHRSFAPGAH